MKALYPTIAWLIEVQGPVGKQGGYLKSSTACIDVHRSKSSGSQSEDLVPPTTTHPLD